ncbi:MAG: DUF4956 domain-containing protein [Planctomycetota bacterium]|nr:DUF4956 domain-containing protein [Pirellulaceae bacterium]MEC7598041.1 DUF4956 domain-containing protein [Planctomycetota bacterium]MEC8241146.1 DUF4956 domain-containing protein [Planctomycetota bacterium]MEC8304428.1 DUF4956 domain-containing protein [Planctomycetota bacterium]MEC8389821.1 DUF4956 domain-containing protein [Planctomycetota bacterium]
MEFLEVPIFDDDLYKLLVRLAINLFFMILVVRLTVLPNQRDREFAFTAVMLNITVFFICFTLKKLELGLGMALGLFAIFGVLRYRTDTLRTKEMTYLFMLIGLAVINSLSNRKTSYVELAAVNSFILIAALINEAVLSRILSKDKTDEVAAEALQIDTKKNGDNGGGKPKKTTVTYDRLTLLGKASRDELIADITERTGFEIVKIQVTKVDLKESLATLTIWHHDADNPAS